MTLGRTAENECVCVCVHVCVCARDGEAEDEELMVTKGQSKQVAYERDRYENSSNIYHRLSQHTHTHKNIPFVKVYI